MLVKLTPSVSVASLWKRNNHQLLHRLALHKAVTNLHYLNDVTA
jgi:hypothetical protein